MATRASPRVSTSAMISLAPLSALRKATSRSGSWVWAHFLFLFCLKISFVRFTYRWFVATLLDLRVSILPSHATTFSKVAHFASPSISCKPTPPSLSVSMSLCLCLSCHVQVFQSVGTPYGGHDRFFLPQQSGSYVSSNSLE